MNAVPDRDIISCSNPPVPSTEDVQRRILKAQAAIQETDYDFLEHLSPDSPDDVVDVISFDEFPELDQRSLQDHIWIGRIEAALKIPEHLKKGAFRVITKVILMEILSGHITFANVIQHIYDLRNLRRNCRKTSM